jgi:hypothetical protein
VYFIAGAIAVPVQIVCTGTPVVNVIVDAGLTVIVPLKDTAAQLPPVVVTV